MTGPIDDRVSQLHARIAASGATIDGRLSALHRLPAVVHWNRLEGRPRADDLTRPVRAEVRDALWMLARQWQFGEFDGDDAGTPIRAKLSARAGAVAGVAMREGAPRPFDATTQALEPLVERVGFEPDLMMRLHIGLRWRAALRSTFGDASSVEAGFVEHYPIGPPAPGGRDLASMQLATNRPELALRLATGVRSIDGGVVLADIRAAQAASTRAADAFAARGVPVDGNEDALDASAAVLLASFDRLIVPSPAADDDAWVADRLEHAFSVVVADAPARTTTLRAEGYVGGHLDWHAFDALTPVAVTEDAGHAIASPVASFIPTPARFAGAPSTRWWEFEDTRVGFGLTSASKTDIVKLLLAQFALVASNDWFIVPLALDTGTLVEIRGIVVSDNFGCNTLVEPTSVRHQALGLAGRWCMWNLSRGDAPGRIDPRLFLAPGLPQTLEAAPLDEVVFVRDEVANLVWGIETAIPDALGGARDARGAARQLRELIGRAYPAPAPVADAPDDVMLTYRLMGNVPENWIPLAAVRLAGQTASSAFVQGAMPRVPALTPPANADDRVQLAHQLVLPRGELLHRSPVERPNVIREEELMRGGAVLQRSFQQTRTASGGTITWAGRRKLNGRGEGSSGLSFDQALRRQR